MSLLDHSDGAASLSEGQRLLAQRRGWLRQQMRAYPLLVNCALALGNLGWVYALDGFLLIQSFWGGEPAPNFDEAVYFIVASLLLTLAIFIRDRAPVVLLLVAGCVNLVQALVQDYSSMGVSLNYAAGLTGAIFLYEVAIKYSWKGIFPVFLIALTLDTAAITVNSYRSLILFDNSTVEPSVYNSVRLSIIGSTVLLHLALGAVIVLVARQVRKNRDFENEVLVSFEKTQQLAATEERNLIAREMHDVVAHSLTVMISLADAARIVGKKDSDRAAEVLTELSGTGRTALADMRRTLGVLRDPVGEAAPLSPTEGRGENVAENLAELVESFASTGLPARFRSEGDPIPCDHNLRLSIYRIVQESLTNVLRYGSGASLVEVLVKVELPDIWVSVINDGPSGNPVRRRSDSLSDLGSGKGIAGMRERASFYDGTVEAGENELGGWSVLAHLRWNGRNEIADT